ncbi:hypothetical protein N7450_001756 [Penicillium hetheringtonii]|uniref:Uncharacterized protein n=1 Tax=Penicillium hetheringtonii TaxID=911720 RepID=A0AAD6H1Q6_9EURO|nr:hypothetical protein N7450_001756 [Penicillium hetheringtonii]
MNATFHAETTLGCVVTLLVAIFGRFVTLPKVTYEETRFMGRADDRTTSEDSDTGACYTDGKHAGGGCGVFVKGDDCRLRGTAMQAAYDHLENPDEGGCGACGHVTFDNGCIMKVDYVSSCGTMNN